MSRRTFWSKLFGSRPTDHNSVRMRVRRRFRSSDNASRLKRMLMVEPLEDRLCLNGSWTTVAPMPEPHAGAVYGVIAGKIYIEGGNFSANEIDIYDPVADTWSTGAGDPFQPASPAGGVINGKLYVAGGNSVNVGGTRSEMEVYDPITNSWSSAAPMLFPVSSAASAVIGGKLYVAGGIQQGNEVGPFIDTLQVYDPATDSWAIKSPMPRQLGYLDDDNGAVINGLFYVAGGADSNGNAVDSLLVYNPTTDTWATKTPMPTARVSPGVAALGGILYVAGGRANDINHQDALATVESYNPATDTWTTETPLPTLRNAPVALGYNGVLYVAGGNDVPGHESGDNTVDAFTPGGNIFVTSVDFAWKMGEYTTSGATVNDSLVTSLNNPRDIAVSGGNLFVANVGNGTIGEYTTTGAAVNTALVSGLINPQGIAASGGYLYVTNPGNGTIGKYTTSGATVNAALVSGLALNGPWGIAVSGGNLFVTNAGSGTIGEYTTAGAMVNAALVSGLNTPFGIAASGGYLYVTNYNGNTIGKYTTSGATVNAALVTGLNKPIGIAVFGEDLFVVNQSNNTIGEYTTAGATVNPALISSGFHSPYGIAVLPEFTEAVPLALSITAADATYNGSAYATSNITPTLTPVTAAGTTTYTFYSDAGGASAIPTPTNAGTYYVQGHFASSDTNQWTNADSAITSFTIAKADPTVVVSGYTGGTYDSFSHTQTVAVNGVGTDGQISTASLSGTHAGSYSQPWSYGDANYNTVSGTLAFDIAKADAVFSIIGYSVSYDGQPHTATGSATGVNGENLSGLLNFSGTTHINPGTYLDFAAFSGNANYNTALIPTVDTISFPTDGFSVETQAALNVYKSGDIVATVGALGAFDQSTLDLLATGNYAFRFVFQDSLATVKVNASLVAGSYLGTGDTNFQLAYRNTGASSPLNALVNSSNTSASNAASVHFSVEVNIGGSWLELGSEAIRAFLSKK